MIISRMIAMTCLHGLYMFLYDTVKWQNEKCHGLLNITEDIKLCMFHISFQENTDVSF